MQKILVFACSNIYTGFRNLFIYLFLDFIVIFNYMWHLEKCVFLRSNFFAILYSVRTFQELTDYTDQSLISRGLNFGKILKELSIKKQETEQK